MAEAVAIVETATEAIEIEAVTEIEVAIEIEAQEAVEAKNTEVAAVAVPVVATVLSVDADFKPNQVYTI